MVGGGGKPAGLKTIGVYGCLGTEARDVLVFEAQSHDDIRELVNYEIPPISTFIRRWISPPTSSSKG